MQVVCNGRGRWIQIKGLRSYTLEFEGVCSTTRRVLAVDPSYNHILKVRALKNEGYPFTEGKQQTGDVVITLPGAYNQGWNNGPNLAEATDYACDQAAAIAATYRPCGKFCQSHSGKDQEADAPYYITENEPADEEEEEEEVEEEEDEEDEAEDEAENG
ncbi:MAG: hypothetical protein M1829_000905 [Trizodia sp. TS-e1964]|nr:MAG: hypothetical protein M1829_000905 [Trizodia sp. TS-e1964]